MRIFGTLQGSWVCLAILTLGPFFTFRLRIEIDKPLIVDSLTSKPRLELSTMKQLRMYVKQLRPCPFIACLSSFVVTLPIESYFPLFSNT